MNVEQNTGKPARLSLSERAKQGLLEAEPELSLSDLLELEHPTDHAARMALSRAIKAAIAYGDLAASIRQWERPGLTVNRDWLRLPPLQHKPTQCSEHLLERETYRQWRAQCPARLLSSDLSHIGAWLGDLVKPARPATPEPVEPSLPERRQRIDAISDAIRAALVVLSPSGAYPRPHELFDYLAKNDSTRTITGLAKGNRALLWIDDNGNEQRLTFSALGKRLERIRQGD